MGTAEIRMRLAKANYLITVSTAMMCVLMLFNKETTYTYEYIKLNTELPENLLQSTLYSLCTNSKKATKLLIKKPNNNKFTLTDEFTVVNELKATLKQFTIDIKQYQNK